MKMTIDPHTCEKHPSWRLKVSVIPLTINILIIFWPVAIDLLSKPPSICKEQLRSRLEFICNEQSRIVRIDRIENVEAVFTVERLESLRAREYS